ncbi:MAG: HAD family hydrolase [Nitrososphaeria archaeon]
MKKQKENYQIFSYIDKSWTLFLDRDGVINKKIENGYVTKWEEFEFLPGALNAMNILSSIFGKIIIITNQRGIARGLMREKDLYVIHKNMVNIFQKYSINITKIYYCPHDYKDNCKCRKPQTGMIEQALKDFNDIDLKKSIFVGDSEIDILTAKNAGILSVLVGTNTGKNLNIKPDFYFNNLFDFVLKIKKDLNKDIV